MSRRITVICFKVVKFYFVPINLKVQVKYEHNNCALYVLHALRINLI